MPLPRTASRLVMAALLAFGSFGCEADTALGSAVDGAVHSDAGDSDAVDSDAGGEMDAGGGDAGASAGGDGGAPADEDAGGSDGLVPLFVAVGWGGRRIASCDDGRTWIADQQEAPQSEDNWHRTYTPKSLAYADGVFVFLTGWGNPSTAWVSRDGVDWIERPLDATYGGVGWDGTRWVLVGTRHNATTDDLFETVEILEDVDDAPHARDAAAFEGIWAAGASGAASARLPGGAWTPIGSCAGDRHGSIGVRGGFAAGRGRLVSFGDDGATCVVDIATGADLGAGDMASGRIHGRGAFVGDRFVLASEGVLYESEDGLSWTSRDLPDGVDFNRIARADSGTYVAVGGARVGGDRFYYSDDGEAWTEADAPPGNNILRVIAGYGEPSALCPAR